MFRQPLWEVQSVDSRAVGDFRARNIPVLDIHELAAGKLTALFARHQARDLFISCSVNDSFGLNPSRIIIFPIQNQLKSLNCKHNDQGHLRRHKTCP